MGAAFSVVRGANPHVLAQGSGGEGRGGEGRGVCSMFRRHFSTPYFIFGILNLHNTCKTFFYA